MENQDIEEIVNTLAQQLERESGKKIFTIAPLDNRDNPNELEVIAVFEDRQILMAVLTVEVNGDDIQMRMRGNYIN